MNKGKLIELMNQFVAEQDDDYKDKYWGTQYNLYKMIFHEFTKWLIAKGEL